jgi:FkbH-like protein
MSPFDLPWLLSPPTNVRATLRETLAAERLDEAQVRKLGTYALDLGGLESLGKVVRKHRESLIRDAGLTPFRLGIASSHTMDYLVAALPGTALRHNLVLEVVLAGFGQAAQQLLDPNSELSRAELDAVLLALDYQALGLGEARLTAKDAEVAVTTAIDYVADLAAAVRAGIGTCILQTLVAPSNALFGSFDARVPGSPRAMIESFNLRLLREVARDTDLVFDAAFLANTVGLNAWNDARDWHKAKLPGALDSTVLHADHICRLLAAARGRARKCLVLDLDNTLWGGVIGDDGLEGIHLGQGSSIGEAYVALQRYIADLRRRGVILAVCSKNDDANARIPFRDHPEMVLKEDSIAVFVANWSDKAHNIREIAATLNIGADAIVFLDDNPAERALVRDLLPEVAVPELTADPADYIRLLSSAGYFEATTFSQEDVERAGFYQANAERASLQRAGNLEDYLQSLEMVATISPFNSIGRVRIAQLINKSNQFNLTTRRYSERDVEQFEKAPDKFCLQLSLADRFGDNGMISVVIFDRAADEWRCDTWLMSCRVLGRRVEELMLAAVAEAAGGAGAGRLVGVYLPTKKNSLVANHFSKLGFEKVLNRADGGTEWVLDLAKYQAPVLPIAVVRPDGYTTPDAAEGVARQLADSVV